MTEEANGNQQAASTENGAKPPEIDYEAKYREAVAHSREWEKRAKDNKAAANGKALADYIAEKTKPKVLASSESNQPPAPSGSSGDWIRDQFLEQKQK